MRNMLVVGRARWEIYLANYAVRFVTAVAFLVCWFLGGLYGRSPIGVWQDVNGLLLRLCRAVVRRVLHGHLLPVVHALHEPRRGGRHSRAVVGALLMLSSYMLNALNQPEFQQGMAMTEAGLQPGPHAEPELCGAA